MYFVAKMGIDPSQLTRIKSVVPQSMWGKVLATLTLGSTSKKLEQETFTVLSILNQFHDAFLAINIKNAVRVSVDNHNFFEDKSGIEDDLDQAMFELKYKIDPIESEHFDFVDLVLEHKDEKLKYLIDIQIHKKHNVGEFPIQIWVRALFSEFKRNEYENPDDLMNRMSHLFNNQDTYDNYVKEMEEHFMKFLDELEKSLISEIQVDYVQKSISYNIVRPEKDISKFEKFENCNKCINFDDSVLINKYVSYLMFWLKLAYDNHIQLGKFSLIDKNGNLICILKESTIKANEYKMFDIAVPFSPVALPSISYYSGNMYDDILYSRELVTEENEDNTDNSMEWLAGRFDFIY